MAASAAASREGVDSVFEAASADELVGVVDDASDGAGAASLPADEVGVSLEGDDGAVAGAVGAAAAGSLGAALVGPFGALKAR